ncbi:uncharacterized protein BBA_06834 [Beauveria bassiana ARSEF 2860]|uniref:Biotrophy-associated secreted protein 2 n=1 Tax=Beauveria bassiana (strain ARSEF 2860) TaxID=655819 RepID=J4W0T5_BEAB2|nr:uncharacterized protein BBA_06834 [Beauveria bassiana ARSEF 2860]EJP64130.1 hypothetical protein BBA_06834 [Beauveria bassiana ARSEF 2860]
MVRLIVASVLTFALSAYATGNAAGNAAGAANIVNGQGKQSNQGACISDADCRSGCCAGLNNAAVCSARNAAFDQGKRGCGFRGAGAGGTAGIVGNNGQTGVIGGNNGRTGVIGGNNGRTGGNGGVGGVGGQIGFQDDGRPGFFPGDRGPVFPGDSGPGFFPGDNGPGFFPGDNGPVFPGDSGPGFPGDGGFGDGFQENGSLGGQGDSTWASSVAMLASSLPKCFAD